MCDIYVYEKSQKVFKVCAFMRLENVKENIESDANLHFPRDRVKTPFEYKSYK